MANITPPTTCDNPGADISGLSSGELRRYVQGFIKAAAINNPTSNKIDVALCDVVDMVRPKSSPFCLGINDGIVSKKGCR